MIEFRAVPGDTGRLLRQLLIARGVELGAPPAAQAVVSYGVPIRSELPTLNGRAGSFNKFEELSKLKAANVAVPPFSQAGADLTFPILGRKYKHTKARDIVPILQNDREFEWRTQGGACDYFVQYIPKRREYRVWAYRRRVDATYEKVMRYPERYRVGRDAGLGWNWDHGFAFEFLHEAPQQLKDLGAAAVDALGLDFGAVDIIESTNGQLYVLEVNTAPGVQEVRQGIDKLADHMVKWVQNGYPRRNGANAQ